MKARYDENKAAAVLQTAFWTLEDRYWEWGERGLGLKSLTVRPPKEPGLDWTMVVRADVDGEAVIAFLDAERPERLFSKLVGSIAAGSLKWREDQYAK